MAGLKKIISGGQSGVDRVALDMAIELGFACGGWCPAGRKAEDGPIPDAYPLDETPSGDYIQRTKWNIRDSDATLVLYLDHLRGGSALTVSLAEDMGKPVQLVNLNANPSVELVVKWLDENCIEILNVAGPRASQEEQASAKAAKYIRSFLMKL